MIYKRLITLAKLDWLDVAYKSSCQLTDLQAQFSLYSLATNTWKINYDNSIKYLGLNLFNSHAQILYKFKAVFGKK